MNIKNLFLTASALLAFMACSSDDAQTSPAAEAEGRIPILLSGGFGVETRSSQELQNDWFDVGRLMDVLIDSKDGLTTYDSQQYKVNDTQGKLMPVSGAYPYYPINGSGVDIRAIYPVGYSSASSFTVEQTQTDDNSYTKSDLMFASASVDVAQTAAVPLTFYHKMTKICVNLTATGDVDLAGSIVKLLDLRTTVNFDPYTGAVGEATGNKKTMTISENGIEDCAAVIVPQVFPGGYLIEVRLANNDILNYRSVQTIPFESGKKYIYNIEVTESGIKVASKVEPWLTTDDVSARPRLDE